MSKNYQKLYILKKKVIFFNKIANGNFVEKKTIFVNFLKKCRFWQFFDIQMAIFRRVRYKPASGSSGIWFKSQNSHKNVFVGYSANHLLHIQIWFLQILSKKNEMCISLYDTVISGYIACLIPYTINIGSIEKYLYTLIPG